MTEIISHLLFQIGNVQHTLYRILVDTSTRYVSNLATLVSVYKNLRSKTMLLKYLIISHITWRTIYSKLYLLEYLWKRDSSCALAPDVTPPPV